MSDLEPEFQQQAFPVLTDEQIELLRPFGEVRRTQGGDVLYEVGDAAYPLVVVLSGRTAIIDRSDESDQLITTTGPGEFNGELGLLTGQTVFAACVVREPGEVLILPPDCVHEVIETIPTLSDVLITAFTSRRRILMRVAAATLTLIGPESSPSTLRLQEFVSRNRIPSRWFPPDDPVAMALLDRFHPHGPDDGDVWVVVRGEKALRDPSNLYLAQSLGLDLVVKQNAPADLVVVGAGPAGLSAAVYGASEGLTTVAVDDLAIGGQAGTSSRIENYLGFPTGISGGELAFRAEVQAVKFGARVTVPRRATALTRADGHYVVCLDDRTELRGRSVIIATGARYRRLGLPNQERYDGVGIFYAATDLEARRCRDAEVVVVGGGNAAGQAAMFLAETASCVHLVCRGPVLGRSMSHYLVSRLQHAPNVRIHTGTEVQVLEGDERLESATVVNGRGQRETVAVRAVFVMVGSDPCTDWLQGAIDLDDRGFVLTGQSTTPSGGLPTARSPYETNLPGVFAVGDVRSGSVKRVASAVGEGAVVVQAVHHYLAGVGNGER